MTSASTASTASQGLAAAMGARYVALPYANAAALSRAVRAAARRP